jgi:DNA-binding NarL/FixJ family response regulator
MTTTTDHDDVARLTDRELAVLCLLVEGCTAAAMAHRLGISVRTVQKHLEHMYRKLEVTDRLRAVLAAQQAGLLPDR